jgi:hypothetical protein
MDWPHGADKDNKSITSAPVTSFIGFDDDLMIKNQLNFQNQRFFYPFLKGKPFSINHPFHSALCPFAGNPFPFWFSVSAAP